MRMLGHTRLMVPDALRQPARPSGRNEPSMAPADEDPWDTFAALRNESNGVALAGAQASIVNQQAKVLGGQEPALCLCCANDDEHTKLVIRVSGEGGYDSGE